MTDDLRGREAKRIRVEPVPVERAAGYLEKAESAWTAVQKTMLRLNTAETPAECGTIRAQADADMLAVTTILKEIDDEAYAVRADVALTKLWNETLCKATAGTEKKWQQPLPPHPPPPLCTCTRTC